jgi:hypothetical protein
VSSAELDIPIAAAHPVWKSAVQNVGKLSYEKVGSIIKPLSNAKKTENKRGVDLEALIFPD